MVLMITGSTGLSLRPVFTLPIFSTTSIPCTTVPKIVCLLSNQSVGPQCNEELRASSVRITVSHSKNAHFVEM